MYWIISILPIYFVFCHTCVVVFNRQQPDCVPQGHFRLASPALSMKKDVDFLENICYNIK